VIPFPRTPLDSPWEFWDYVQGKSNEIEAWYQSLSEDGQFTFDSLLKLNSKASTPLGWNSSKAMQGECKEHGIWEWRFFDDGVQQRLAGIFLTDRKNAAFLIGFTHKQNVYDPAGALDTAVKRAKEVRNGTATLVKRKVKSSI